MPQGIFEDPHHEREDLRQVAVSLKRGWKVDPRIMDLAMLKCQQVLMRPEVGRSTMTAIRAIQMAVSQNIELVKLARGDKPQVVINNNIGQKDTLSEFLEGLSPEDAQDWLDKYGASTAETQADDRGTVEGTASEVSDQGKLPEPG